MFVLLKSSNIKHFTGILTGFLRLLSTLYRSYHDGYFYGHRKPEHAVGVKVSVL